MEGEGKLEGKLEGKVGRKGEGKKGEGKVEKGLEGMVEAAVENKRSGRFNCAQSVACAFADAAGVDSKIAERLTGAFGTGMGCMEGTCGALIGAGFIVSAVSPERMSAMKSMRGIVSAFQAKNGATVCKFLKGIESGVPLRSCDGCVEDAACLLQDFLRENVMKR